MSVEGISTQILGSNKFRSAVSTLAKQSVVLGLPTIEPDSGFDAVDWNFALFCSSAVNDDFPETAQDAALRVAQGCLLSANTDQFHKQAASVLLNRMGNKPALDLALSRSLIEDVTWDEAPAPVQLDAVRRALDLSIPVGRGESIRANFFQKQFWVAASGSSWVSVSAPTSAGKSYIVRRWLQERFAFSEQALAIYLVPTRALIDEVSQALQEDPAFADVRVFTLPWDVTVGSYAKEVHVLTQERLHVLYQRFPALAPDVVFVDEAQKFGDGARGVLLQRVVDETIRRSTDTQVLLASPLSENPELLLDGAPLGRRSTAVVSEGVTVNQNLLWVNAIKGKPTEWRVQIILNGEPEEVGGFTLAARPTPESKRLPLVATALGKNEIGNVVYVNGAADAEKTARQLYEALGDEFDLTGDPEIEALRELIGYTIHPRYALREVLLRGIAFHYGNMPLLVRAEVERLFRAGSIRFLVCTSTLLEGVNLPCRNIFVRGPRKGNNAIMSPFDFWNLAGRAGRWGKEFQGNVICVDTSNERQWPIPPRSRVRQPLRRATQDVTNELDRLLRFIRSGTQLEDAASWANGESVYSLLADRVARGINVADIPSLNIPASRVQEVQDAVVQSLGNVQLPQSVFGRHPGVSPLAMQRLLDYFASRADKADLELTTPEDFDAATVYVKALSRISRTLGGNFGPPGRQMQLAILLVTWMRGQPLARIIVERLEFNATRQKPLPFGTVVRGAMADVEQFARFEAPKYLGCYSDVLRYHQEEIGAEQAELPDIEMMLELGVSRQTEVSLMALGLSRTSAIALSEYIVEDDFTPEQCREWIRGRGVRRLDLPELVVRDIERAVPGAAVDDQ